MLTLLFTDSRGERNNRENLLPSALHPPLQSLGSFSLYHPSLSPLVLCLPLSLSFIPFFSLLLLAPILEICLLLLSIPRYLTLAVIPLFGNLLLLSPFSTLSTLHSLSITAGLLYEDDSSRLCFHSPSLLSSPNPPVPPPPTPNHLSLLFYLCSFLQADCWPLLSPLTGVRSFRFLNNTNVRIPTSNVWRFQCSVGSVFELNILEICI